jgi:hypothetical protein
MVTAANAIATRKTLASRSTGWPKLPSELSLAQQGPGQAWSVLAVTHASGGAPKPWRCRVGRSGHPRKWSAQAWRCGSVLADTHAAPGTDYCGPQDPAATSPSLGLLERRLCVV